MPVGAWRLEYGCNLIADANMVSSYVAHAQDPAYCVDGVNELNPYGLAVTDLNVNCGCDALNWDSVTPGVAPSPITPYTSPAADIAPWYTATAPESAFFWGYMIEKVEEVSTPPIARSSADKLTSYGGTTLGPLRKKGRVMKITLLAFGSGETSLDYGFRWLTDLLTTQNTECELCEMSIRTACAPLSNPPTWAEWDTGRWTFKDVALISGPRYEEPPLPSAVCNIRRVSFVVAAAVPYAFKCPVEVLTDATWIDQIWVETPGGCPPLDWICNNVNSVCTSVGGTSGIGEEALMLEIQAGPCGIYGLEVSITPDPFGYVCNPATAPAGYVSPEPCDTLLVPSLPANYTLNYDSTTQTITVTKPGGEVEDGTPYLDATAQTLPSYTVMRGGSFCVCVTSQRYSWNSDPSKVTIWTVHQELGI